LVGNFTIEMWSSDIRTTFLFLENRRSNVSDFEPKCTCSRSETLERRYNKNQMFEWHKFEVRDTRTSGSEIFERRRMFEVGDARTYKSLNPFFYASETDDDDLNNDSTKAFLLKIWS
jgi:hypothetical protein